ncbi:MAG: ABC transporter permease subunit [Deferribacteraceae bacterium]|jgi:polar amino acid transport system substrate-binding protein|nr:ABC transporter permease subunit [Deferribacteraceae bacterium]
MCAENRYNFYLIKAAIFLAVLSWLVIPVYASDNVSDNDSGSQTSYKSLYGKKIGVLIGSSGDDIAISALNAEVFYYLDILSGIEDVRKGRIDGFIEDLSVARVIADDVANRDLGVVVIPAEFFKAPIGVMSLNQGIVDRFNAFLEIIKYDGILLDMQKRWFDNDLDTPMPDIVLTGDNGTLRVAICAMSMPFVYLGANSSFKGYSMELVLRFAAHFGLKVEFIDMDFSGLIPYIVSGKADLAVANISITEERKKSVIFTEPIFDDLAAVIVLKKVVRTAENDTFFNWLKEAVKRNLITDNRWQIIVKGLFVTIFIAVSSLFFGTIFAGLICCLLTRKNRYARRVAGLYCSLIYGTPAVVLLMISYYIIFDKISISNIAVAIAAFTMVEASTVAQNLRSAIETVDPVEIEAARSMGFTSIGAFLAVTLPQAVRKALPSYAFGFVELVKATAIVGFIAINDLTRASDIIRSRTYDAYFPILLVTLIYLIIMVISVWIFKIIAGKLNRGRAK